jgi:hypothetical protein
MFKVTLRELFLLTALCAVVTTWLVDRHRLTAANAALSVDAAKWKDRTDLVFQLYRDDGQWIEWNELGDETTREWTLAVHDRDEKPFGDNPTPWND